jgi:hypothetical protein
MFERMKKLTKPVKIEIAMIKRDGDDDDEDDGDDDDLQKKLNEMALSRREDDTQ